MYHALDYQLKSWSQFSIYQVCDFQNPQDGSQHWSPSQDKDDNDHTQHHDDNLAVSKTLETADQARPSTGIRGDPQFQAPRCLWL